MPERTSHPSGVPSWIDIASPDVDTSVAFYGGLFGWAYEPVPGPPEETGGYGGFALLGKAVAGIGPLQNPRSRLSGRRTSRPTTPMRRRRA